MGEYINDPNEILVTNSNSVIQIGKRNFFRVQYNPPAGLFKHTDKDQ